MTSDETRHASFGRYLRSVRIDKGIDIKNVAEETKISLTILEKLESENHDHLPDPIYVRGFIQAYAGVVGADPVQALEKYAAGLAKRMETVATASELSKRKTRFWYHFITCFSLLAFIVGVSVFLMSDNERAHTEAIQKPPSGSEAHRNRPEGDVPGSINPPKTRNAATDSLTLAVSALEKTWLKIIIDDQAPQEYLLEPGDHLELESSAKFNILIGNAAGIKLMFNDKPVKVYGKKGQVVTMQLP